ncbi:MAG: metal-sensitive transcriptional regulator [Planctomycetota bacterium]|jgi:DNA-binding FrmR family transcriptional regulator
MKSSKKRDKVKHKTSHKENLDASKRINGQVEGIQGMIEDERYCVDIVIQIHAAVHAPYQVGEGISAKHIEHCVRHVLTGKSKREITREIDEIMRVMRNVHTSGGN